MDDAKELEAIEQARLLNATAEYAKAELICRAGLENSQLSLANKTQWQLILIESLRRRGLIQEALPLAQEVFEWSGVTGIPRDRAMALSYLANLHYFLGAFSSAIDCYTLAIQLFESINDTERLAVVTSNLAVVFTDTAQHDKALEYYQKALNILALGTNDEAKANTIGNIGNVYMNLGDYAKALDAYTEAYELHHQAGRDAEASIFLGNIGNVYATVSDYTKALDYYHQTLRIHESIDDSASIARIVGNIGIVYLELKMFDKALEFYEKALAIHKHIGDAAGEARVLGNMGTVYQSLAQPEKSIECLLEAKAMNEEIGNPDGVADMVGSLGISYRDAGDFEKALECTIQGIALHEALRARSDVAIGKSHLATLYSTADTDYYDPDKSELLLKEAIEVCTELGTTNLSSGMYAKLADLYQQTSEWEKCVSALRMHQELQSQLQTEDAANRALQHDSQRKLEDSERDRRVKLARFQEQEKVLNNILPENITLRLIKGEKTIADHFDCVSVLFMDIVGFTPLASSVSAQELVLLLNTIFSAADAVMREFGLEKIKTIGDAYMAVAGAPHVQDDHAYRAAKAALGLRDAMQHTFQTFPETHGNAEWTQLIPKVNVRIGVHCGPVAAGVVGEIKFLYDLWGDAVNTAARMESHGQARRVHVSHDFMCEVLTQQPKLHELSFEDRGEMEIKGKGMMRTYFLERA